MMIRMTVAALLLGLVVAGGPAAAQANLEISTPAITSLRSSMRSRHAELRAHYVSGALGLTRDGSVALRDANAVPLAQRQQVNGLVAADNQDRAALYREIARANGHPEWEAEIRATFAQRWIDRARAGWYYQTATGAWVQK